jgi:hypothetical protein
MSRVRPWVFVALAAWLVSLFAMHAVAGRLAAPLLGCAMSQRLGVPVHVDRVELWPLQSTVRARGVVIGHRLVVDRMDLRLSRTAMMRGAVEVDARLLRPRATVTPAELARGSIGGVMWPASARRVEIVDGTLRVQPPSRCIRAATWLDDVDLVVVRDNAGLRKTRWVVLGQAHIDGPGRWPTRVHIEAGPRTSPNALDLRLIR